MQTFSTVSYDVFEPVVFFEMVALPIQFFFEMVALPILLNHRSFKPNIFHRFIVDSYYICAEIDFVRLTNLKLYNLSYLDRDAGVGVYKIRKIFAWESTQDQ